MEPLQTGWLGNAHLKYGLPVLINLFYEYRGVTVGNPHPIYL